IVDVADADQCFGQQRHDDRQHLLAREARLGQVAAQRATQFWQARAEGHEAIELARAAFGLPLRVVAILLAPARVAASGLQMSVGVWTDPDIGPRRRDRQLADPGERGLVAQQAAARIPVTESAARAPARVAGRTVVDMAQAHYWSSPAAMAGSGWSKRQPSSHNRRWFPCAGKPPASFSQRAMCIRFQAMKVVLRWVNSLSKPAPSSPYDLPGPASPIQPASALGGIAKPMCCSA